MSYLPYLLEELQSIRPSRILDQHFGLPLIPEDMLQPTTHHSHAKPFYMPYTTRGYYRPWRTMASAEDTGSTISVDKERFQVSLDVQQFAPNEITVQVTGENMITVEGKHEEKEDEHGYISRHFIRKYVVPKGHNLQKTISNLSSDGVLTILAPRIDVGQLQNQTIPIIQTGLPSKPPENMPTKQQDCGDKKGNV